MAKEKSEKGSKEEKQQKYTKYEIARLIGARALQLSQGAEMQVKLTKKQLEEINYDVIAIAKMEFEKGVLPIRVKQE